MLTTIKQMMHPSLIDVQQLRVGMFVHLEGGEMSHPFPLSSFKIGASAQIATIRALGRQNVRWSPEKSDVADPEPVATLTMPAILSESSIDPPRWVDTAEATAWRKHLEALAMHRAELGLCESQFADATRARQLGTERVSPDTPC